MAAQGGGQHAARARPHDEIRVRDGIRQPVLQAGQRAGRPGRAEETAGAEYQADSRLGAVNRPIRTKDHSRHIGLRNPPHAAAGV